MARLSVAEVEPSRKELCCAAHEYAAIGPPLLAGRASVLQLLPLRNVELHLLLVYVLVLKRTVRVMNGYNWNSNFLFTHVLVENMKEWIDRRLWPGVGVGLGRLRQVSNKC